MSGRAKQIIVTILLVLAVGAVGYVVYVHGGAPPDPYFEAAQAIEEEFGEYVDITYIGNPPESPNTLVVIIVQKGLFESPTDPLFVAFDALLSSELRALIKDEVELDMFILNADLDGGYVVGFDAQGLKGGKTLNETVMASTPISGTPKADPYLKWLDE